MSVDLIKPYFKLAKPGMVLGNLLPAVAGYLLASDLKIKLLSFIALLIGTALIMGAACSVNNLIDRDIDSKMDRTKNRPSVKGQVDLTNSIIYVGILMVIGFGSLLLWVNILCAVIGAIGFIDYAFIYTLLKRRTHHATLVGSIAGAMPVVGAYAAYSDRINLVAITVGLMMLLWQMPHFYAIALYRGNDYRSSNVPVLPLVKGHEYTVRAMVLYSLLFFISVIMLYFVAKLNLAYLVVMGLAVAGWSLFNLHGLKLNQLEVWAKRSFIYSLIVMITMSLMVAVR
jgi:protoheme IX farnesyltransferase